MTRKAPNHPPVAKPTQHGDLESKGRQVDYYDHGVDEEFEITRPHGQSRLYSYLMDYKFNRVVGLLRPNLRGKSVLVICCGSGMDTEYLARLGARVVGLDISPGAIERARARSIRFDVEYDLVVGDAEHLGFPDLSFDYAFVHDGLHHLPEPEKALREMARVSRRGIMITEPADASLTNLLIRLGLMKPYEDAGNYVIRFTARQLSDFASSSGFRRTRSARYLVKYGHPPPRWWNIFDWWPLFGLAKGTFLLFGAGVFGTAGNKIAFAAERSPN